MADEPTVVDDGVTRVITQPAHREQCHEVHPGVPHEQVIQLVDFTVPPLPEPKAAPSVEEPGGEWSVFNEWSNRALEHVGNAVTRAREVADHAAKAQEAAGYDPVLQALEYGAHICAHLAAAAAPPIRVRPDR